MDNVLTWPQPSEQGRNGMEELKQSLAVLVAAQARTEQRMEELAAAQARTEQRMEELVAAQARTEQRLQRLEATVQRLEEAQIRTEERLQRLEEAQIRTEERLQDLTAAQIRTEEQLRQLIIVVAGLKGWQVELRYRDRAGAYFGRFLRGLRVFSPHELENELEPQLSTAEFEDLLELDLLVRGQPRQRPEAPLVWLAVEASAVLDRNDVERAQRRAAILRRAGYRAIPTVAGEQITAGAEEAVCTGHALVIQDGCQWFWETALAAALAD